MSTACKRKDCGTYLLIKNQGMNGSIPAGGDVEILSGDISKLLSRGHTTLNLCE